MILMAWTVKDATFGYREACDGEEATRMTAVLREGHGHKRIRVVSHYSFNMFVELGPYAMLAELTRAALIFMAKHDG